eukprot:Awhi_evm1s10038
MAIKSNSKINNNEDDNDDTSSDSKFIIAYPPADENIKDIVREEIFNMLVPWKVTEAVSMYSEEKAKILRK